MRIKILYLLSIYIYINIFSPNAFFKLKKSLLENLDNLEKQKLVLKKDGYQDLIISIAKDIKTKGKSRKQRKKELSKTKDTLDHVIKINQDLNDQKEYYKDYIRNCIQKTRVGKG